MKLSQIVSGILSRAIHSEEISRHGKCAWRNAAVALLNNRLAFAACRHLTLIYTMYKLCDNAVIHLDILF